MLTYIFSPDIPAHLLEKSKHTLESSGLEVVVSENMSQEDVMKLASASTKETYVVKVSSPAGEFVIEVVDPRGSVLYIKKLYSKEPCLPYLMFPAPSFVLFQVKTSVVRTVFNSWLPGYIFVGVATAAGYSPKLRKRGTGYYFTSDKLTPPKGTVFFCPDHGLLEVIRKRGKKFFLKKLIFRGKASENTKLIPYGVNVWDFAPSW